jgi:putative membrane protein
MLAQMMDRGDMGGSGWAWGWIVGLLVVVGLVALVVVLVTHTNAPQPPSPPMPPQSSRSTADEILAERLARGEIDAEEYRQRRDALRG